MSEQGSDRFEIPKDMRSMAEASFNQARTAFEKFLAGAQQTAGTIEEGGDGAAAAGAIGAKAFPMPKRTCRHRWTMRSRCCRPRI
jgi:hypothetical protein